MRQRTSATNRSGKRLAVRARVNQGAVIGDRTSIAPPAEAARRSDLNGSGIDRGRTGVGVVVGQSQRAAGIVRQRTVATNRSGKRLAVRARVNQGAVIGDRTSIAPPAEAARRSDLNGSGIDRGRTGVGVVVGQSQRAAGVMRQRTSATNRSREVLAVRARVNQRAVIGDRRGVAPSAEAPSRSDLQRAGIDRGRAAVGVVARKREVAGAALRECAGAEGDVAGSNGVADRVKGEIKVSANASGESEACAGICGDGGGLAEGDGTGPGVVAAVASQGGSGLAVPA